MKKCTVHALIVGGGRGGCHGCQIKKTITVSKRVNEEQILRLDFFEKLCMVTTPQTWWSCGNTVERVKENEEHFLRLEPHFL